MIPGAFIRLGPICFIIPCALKPPRQLVKMQILGFDKSGVRPKILHF